MTKALTFDKVQLSDLRGRVVSQWGPQYVEFEDGSSIRQIITCRYYGPADPVPNSDTPVWVWEKKTNDAA